MLTTSLSLKVPQAYISNTLPSPLTNKLFTQLDLLWLFLYCSLLLLCPLCTAVFVLEGEMSPRLGRPV